MEVYRISRKKWANDLTGEGSRLYGGRWNRRGTACIYTSSSRSLAILEYSVNVSLSEIPRSLSLITLKLPEKFFAPATEELPANWQDIPSPGSTREFGTRLLNEMKHLVFRLPSSIIPQEYNFIINPLHPEIRQVKILSVEEFIYDVRLKK